MKYHVSSSSGSFPQEDDAFIPHVENKVDDGEVRKKAMFLLEDLVIRFCREIHHGRDACKGFRSLKGRMNVKELTTFGNKCFVEVHKEGPFLFVKRTEIVLKIFKERGVEVGGLKCIPMLMLPIRMRADAYIFHQTFSAGSEIAFVNGYGQVKRAIR